MKNTNKNTEILDFETCNLFADYSDIETAIKDLTENINNGVRIATMMLMNTIAKDYKLVPRSTDSDKQTTFYKVEINFYNGKSISPITVITRYFDSVETAKKAILKRYPDATFREFNGYYFGVDAERKTDIKFDSGQAVKERVFQIRKIETTKYL